MKLRKTCGLNFWVVAEAGPHVYKRSKDLNQVSYFQLQHLKDYARRVEGKTTLHLHTLEEKTYSKFSDYLKRDNG